MITETLKLKDYKDNPEQYNKIVHLLKMKNIEYSDESSVSDLLEKVSDFNQLVHNIADIANKSRE